MRLHLIWVKKIKLYIVTYAWNEYVAPLTYRNIFPKRFAELIESCYSISFLIQSFMGLICLSVSMFQVSYRYLLLYIKYIFFVSSYLPLQVLMLLDKKAEALRFFASSCAQFVHLLCICYPGQRMIDYSTEIRTKA